MACPRIEVQYWNATQVCVKCPYCEKLHHYGLRLPGKRRSHCRSGGNYEFVLPIDKELDLVGYEIDKRRARFVNVRAEIAVEDSGDSGSDLADVFHSKMSISTSTPNSEPILHFQKDSVEKVTTALPDGSTLTRKIIDGAIASCVCGRYDAVLRYLARTTEAKLFLRGGDERGNTTLILAAAERSHEMVSLLLNPRKDENSFDQGIVWEDDKLRKELRKKLKRLKSLKADPKAVNNKGQSALMEAAFWGRLESVKALLNAGADKTLRNNEGLRAIDLAQPTRENEERRYAQSSWSLQIAYRTTMRTEGILLSCFKTLGQKLSNVLVLFPRGDGPSLSSKSTLVRDPLCFMDQCSPSLYRICGRLPPSCTEGSISTRFRQLADGLLMRYHPIGEQVPHGQSKYSGSHLQLIISCLHIITIRTNQHSIMLATRRRS